jgi:diguanylate cyclase (GGDEF)-like protein/PAS domain S-box-containing protein
MEPVLDPAKSLAAARDGERLRALGVTGLLDSPPEAAFDRLVRLAASLLRVPVAAISLVDADRQFIKSAVGLGEPWASLRETPLTHSFCQYVVAERVPLVVANALEHPILKTSVGATELGVVAYAGVPLITPDRHALGAFCVVDGKVRDWTDDEIAIMKDLAASVMTEIELRRAVRELATSEALYRTVAETAHDAMITTDANGEIVFWNRAAEELFGYSVGEMVGHCVKIIVPERNRETYREDLRRNHVGRTAEVRRMKKDGTEFSAELSLSSWSSEKGELLTGILRDVTERNGQRDRLFHLEEQLSLTIENAAIGMALVGVDGRFFRVNKALCEIVGYDPVELLTKTFQEITHPDDLEEDLELVRQLLYGEINKYKLGKRYIHKSGNVVDIMLHVSIVRGAHGEPNHFIAQIEDVTAMKAAERALAQKTMILESVLSQMNEGVLVVDTSSHVLLKNPSAAQTLGPGPLDYDPASRQYLLSPDGKRPFEVPELAHMRALQGERIDQMEVYYQGKPEWPGRWHSVSAAPLRNGASDPIWGAVVVGRDITRLKAADLGLREQTATVQLLQAVAVAANQASTAQEALQEALRLVCEFTSRTVGHVYMVAGEELVPSTVWYATGPLDYPASHEVTSRTLLAPGLDLPGRVAATGHAEFIEDALADSPFLHAGAARSLDIRGGFAFPVVVGSEVVAVFECYAGGPIRRDERLLEVLTHVGSQMGRVIERERYAEAVRNLSLTDELTALHNRRGFMALVAPQLRVATRAHKTAAVLFIDMDGLKKINDQFGHEVGDEAIQALASVLRRTFRESDIVGRLGGDEFVAFLPEATESDAATPERRLQEALAIHNAAENRRYALAVSVGMATFEPDHPAGLDDLLHRADACMYEQKRRRQAVQHSFRPRLEVR